MKQRQQRIPQNRFSTFGVLPMVVVLLLSVFVPLFILAPMIPQIKAVDVLTSGWEDSGGTDVTDGGIWSAIEETPTVTSATKHHGSYAMLLDTNHEYAYYGDTVGTILNTTSQNVRYYYYMTDLPTGTNSTSTIQFRHVGRVLAEVEVFSNKLNFYWNHYAGSDTYDVDFNADQWYCFELEFTISADAGKFVFYLDGVAVYNQTGLTTNADGNIWAIYVGSLSGAYATPDRVIDCAIISDTYIGVESESSGSVSAQAGYDYTLDSNTTAAYVLAENGTLIYSGTPNNAFFMAGQTANNTGSNGLYIKGTSLYNGTAKFNFTGVFNLNVTFSPTSNFTIQNWLNTSTIYLNTCTNVTLYAPNINGNGLNQLATTPVWGNGIEFYECSGCLVNYANITNARQFGFLCGEETPKALPNGITNSNITDCGWNGVSLGWGSYESTTPGHYATGNDISAFSEVGIATWGENSSLIEDNYVHDSEIIGAGGFHNVSYGIRNEYNGFFNYILNNTVANCYYGINTGEDCSDALIKNNTVENCTNGILSGSTGTGYDTITLNTVKNWTGTGNYNPGIGIFGNNSIVSFNTLTNDNTDNGLGSGISVLDNAMNNTVANNTITIPHINAFGSWGILVSTNSDRNIIQGNTIDSHTGIKIADDTCNINKFNENDWTLCVANISDLGTGTIINPASSTTYTLTFNNHNDASGRGTFVYPNTTNVTITTSGVLNVNGVNVTSPHILLKSDSFAYVVDNSVLITTASVSPEPTATAPANNNGPQSSPIPTLTTSAQPNNPQPTEETKDYTTIAIFAIAILVIVGIFLTYKEYGGKK